MPSPSVTPHEPPRFFRDIPPIRGELGPEPEDFVVDEIPLYAPSGEGQHRYVRVRKRCWTTPAMVQAVARAAAVHPRDVGYAGMKDRHAITTQWLSLPDSGTPPDDWKLPDGITVLEQSLHTNKLRTGHLRGNRFTLRLVGADPDDLERGRRLCESLRREGLLNYFGAQRFGLGGQNLARALLWLGGDQPLPVQRGRRPRGPRARFDNKLNTSVVQSEIFNQYLTRRASLGLDRLLRGEVVRLRGSAKVFVVDDPGAERQRLLERDIHLTGPMLGAKTLSSDADARELEREVLHRLGLSTEVVERLCRSAPGTRRDLVVHPEGLRFEPSTPSTIQLTFALPSGAYATQLLRELTHLSWLGLRGDH